MGAIKEIHELNLIISLPNNLTGYVSIAEISEKLSNILENIANNEAETGSSILDGENEEGNKEVTPVMPELKRVFRIGDLITCMILSLESNRHGRKIELTMKPNLINSGIEKKDLYVNMILPAAVLSIEDHGYVMDIGIENVRGFLHLDHAHLSGGIGGSGGGSDSRLLQEGQTVTCTVISLTNNGRAVNLSLDHDQISKATTSESQIVGVEAVLPGMLVNARIGRVMPHGLEVSFCEVFEGTIDWFHLQDHVLDMEQDLMSRYKIGQKVIVRQSFVYCQI